MADNEPNKKILVVEDDQDFREAVAGLLKAGGFTVNTAANGAEALAQMHSGPPPDLIVLDLMMPVLNGWQFRTRQQEEKDLADIPVLVISGAGDLKNEADALHAAGVLQKPIEVDQLMDMIRQLVSQTRLGILVVDDEPQVRNLLAFALGQHGFTVWTAGDGQEGVEVYRQHQDEIALVLLDVQMPELDGPWTLAALQKINPRVRCCFMSGHTGSYTPEMLLAMGAAAVFQKPFGLAQVTQSLQQVIQGAK